MLPSIAQCTVHVLSTVVTPSLRSIQRCAPTLEYTAVGAVRSQRASQGPAGVHSGGISAGGVGNGVGASEGSAVGGAGATAA